MIDPWLAFFIFCPLLALGAGVLVYGRLRPALPAIRLTLAPVAITLLVGIWTAVVSPYSEYGDDWAVNPVLIALAVVLLWHIALVAKGPSRRVLILYAFVHLAFWMPFGLFCLIVISKDSL